MGTDWFAAHKDGLRNIVERLIERRGFGIIAGELYQNVQDTSATFCKLSIKPVPGKAQVYLWCEDDGPGFADLTHAWMMFAPSAKKDDPEKAGRFNVGEKYVLSLCREAKISTTSGTVTFDKDGRKLKPRSKLEVGTCFYAVLDCTRNQMEEFAQYVNMLIVRPGLTLTFNGEPAGLMDHTGLSPRRPIHIFKSKLRTEIGENLRSSERITEVQVFEALEGETAMLYELGIPVVETGDKWHVNVMQKVPLNTDRDNVTPSYLRSVRLAVVNEMHDKLTADDTTSSFVIEATSDPGIDQVAMSDIFTKQFGEKRVALDPNNPEANGAAVAAGYTPIAPRGITSGQRENAYRFGILHTSSEEFPTAGKGAYSDHGKPVDIVPADKWSDSMKVVVAYAQFLGMQLLGKRIGVRIVNCKSFVGKPWGACYGDGELDFNIWKLGKKWFENLNNETVDKLLLHEFAHDYEGNHLADDYHEAICMLGAKLKRCALEKPTFFHMFDSFDAFTKNRVWIISELGILV